MMKKIKPLLLLLSQLYLSLYIPVAIMTYFTPWYRLNFQFHHYWEIIGYDAAIKHIHELTDFLLHQYPLTSQWTTKEQLHLAQVRGIFDISAIIAAMTIILFVTCFDRKKAAKFPWLNLFIISWLLLAVLFFDRFWEKIFHPLLFDNHLWINNFLDRSFYIMPPGFFKNSLVLLIILSSLFHVILWLYSRGGRN